MSESETTLNALGAIISDAVPDIQEFRRKHKGFVPRGLFSSLLQATELYVAFEVLSFTRVGDLLLRKREEDEGEWKKIFHIPGIAIRPGMSQKTLFEEMFVREQVSNEPVQPFSGATLHFEPQRKAYCITVQGYNIVDTTALSGAWKVFSHDELRKLGNDISRGEEVPVVDHHIATGILRGQQLFMGRQPEVISFLHEEFPWLPQPS